MAPVHQVVVLFLTLVCWLISCHARDIPDVEQDSDDLWPVLCPRNTFYSRDQDQCLTCSDCPINKIITTPCHGLHDTKCGPFYEFKEFLLTDSSPSEDKLEPLTTHHHTIPGTDGKGISRHDLGVSSSERTLNSAFEFANSEWKPLPVFFFVFLSFFAIIILGVGICIFRRKNGSGKKLILEYNPPVEDV